MKRTLLALIVAARVLALPVGTDADQGPAADAPPGAFLREDVYGAWDTCGDAPAPGQTCAVTAITAAQESGTFGTDGGITVNRGVYQVSDTGEKQWHWDDGWYAFSVGAIQFTMDRHLNSATASGAVDLVMCGADGSACGGATLQVSISLIAAGEATTSRNHSSSHQGVSMTTATGSLTRRPAVATATIDGTTLGESLQAYMEVGSGHRLQLTRTGGIKGLGELYRPLWHLTQWGSGPQASAQLDSCLGAAAGDVCAVTLISAAGWTDYGWTELELRRFSYTIDQNGQRVPGLIQQAVHRSPVTLTVDRHLTTASVSGVVQFNECTGELPDPGGPPPPLPSDPLGNCTLVSHAVSVNWTATGKRVQVDDSHSSGDGEIKTTARKSTDFRPAVASGTFDGEDMGESTWAQIIDREERAIVNGNGRNLEYFPPWALTPADANAKVAAEWDTCEYAVRDGIDIDEPGPGDICVWTRITAYKPSGSADNAQLWVLQLMHRYGETEPILVSWWEGRGAVDLTVDSHLNTATVTGVVDFVGCAETPARECARGTRQISASWQAVQQPVRFDTEQFRLSTATGTIDGEAIPGIESRWAVIGGPLPGNSGR